MSDCKHCLDDFHDVYVNGHHDTVVTFECEITGEPCAVHDSWSICPKEGD